MDAPRWDRAGDYERVEIEKNRLALRLTLAGVPALRVFVCGGAGFIIDIH
jgi:hypothetical protein